jgi:hypothetical protein
VHRAGRNLGNRCAAIVAILAEAFGHDEVADHKEHNERERKQKRKSEQMTPVLKSPHDAVSLRVDDPQRFGVTSMTAGGPTGCRSIDKQAGHEGM